ncbi:MAG: extracellular solute-binding protein [Alphaproteobacteria bacterium]
MIYLAHNHLSRILLLVVTFLWCAAQADSESHYVALRGMGQPKYKQNFAYFDYVNPCAPKGGHLNLYTSYRFDSLNPYKDMGTPAPHADWVFATLMKSSRDNMDVSYPFVAQYVQVDRDYKFVTFSLRKKAFFHNGDPITAHDVAVSFQVLKRGGKVSWRPWLAQVDRVEILDSHTIKFVFQGSNRDLPYFLGSLPIFSKKDLQKKEWGKQEVMVGSGPYKIKSYHSGKFIIYERIQKWWGENIPCQKGFHNFDEVKVTYYADSRVGFEAFKKGLVDWWKEERISNWHKGYDFKAAQKGQIVKAIFEKPFYHGLTGVFINTRQPHLKDIRVRQALNLLFDFEWLNKTRFFNSYQRNKSIFMNTGYGAGTFLNGDKKGLKEPPCLKPRDRIQKALGLLKEAGWHLKNGILISKRTKKRFSVDLLVYAPGHRTLFENFVQNLKQVGIEAHFKGGDMASYRQRVRDLDFDLVLHFHPHVVIPGPEQELFWKSTEANKPGTLNLSGVQDRKVDDLVQKIKISHNLQDLKTYTSLLDRLITLGYYLIPGWIPEKSYVAYWKKINVKQANASLYDIDTFWLTEQEKRV